MTQDYHGIERLSKEVHALNDRQAGGARVHAARVNDSDLGDNYDAAAACQPSPH